MLLNNVNLVDRIKVPSQRTMTDAGQMIVPCAFARTGIQLYTAKQLGLSDRADNEIVEVHREASDVFATDSMATFRSAPVTVGHPKNELGQSIPVTVDNSSELQVGMLEGAPHRMEDTLAGVLVLTHQKALDALDNDESELSAGYVCDIEDVDGKFYQRNIRANHIAIVGRGRAGASCRISDDADELILALEDEKQKEILASVDDKEVVQDAVSALAMVIADDAIVLLAVQDELTAVLANVKVLEDAAAAQVVLMKEKDDEIAKGVEALDNAIKIGEENVVERCEVLDSARYIADIKDLGDKSIDEIRKIVIADQKPDLDLDGKEPAYVRAVFDMLRVDSDNSTPMQRLLGKHLTDSEDETVKPKADPVKDARAKMIERNSGK